MAEESTQIGWTEEQWNAVQQAVQEEAQRTRVAASFLPTSGPLAADQQTVPRQELRHPELRDPARGESKERLEVDDHSTFWLTTIASNVYLRQAQAADPDLSSALIMFRRAANIVARVEDALIFNGQPGESEPPKAAQPIPPIFTVRGGGKYDGLLANPLSMGPIPGKTYFAVGQELVGCVVAAVSRLEGEGHLGPFACVLGNELFRAAHTPAPQSLVLPSDRIRPFLDGPLLRSSTIGGNLGLVISLAGDPINLVVARDISVRFLQRSVEPRHVLRVSEKISWQIREPDAVVKLEAKEKKLSD